ncbi:MAG: hypothetical protein ACLT98_15360 [Eggerthellaceae bacterium]
MPITPGTVPHSSRHGQSSDERLYDEDFVLNHTRFRSSWTSRRASSCATTRGSRRRKARPASRTLLRVDTATNAKAATTSRP